MARSARGAGKRSRSRSSRPSAAATRARSPRSGSSPSSTRFLDAGLRNISLADTAGHATPEQVESLFGRVLALETDIECACHFHNTYGLALANCYAALRAGVTSFEGSVAGLGGCPFTAVAGGNTCTEDLVHALQRVGRATRRRPGRPDRGGPRHGPLLRPRHAGRGLPDRARSPEPGSSSARGSAMPARGVRVLDLTNVLAGPFCCHSARAPRRRGDQGRDPGGGDLARQLGAVPELNGASGRASSPRTPARARSP